MKNDFKIENVPTNISNKIVYYFIAVSRFFYTIDSKLFYVYTNQKLLIIIITSLRDSISYVHVLDSVHFFVSTAKGMRCIERDIKTNELHFSIKITITSL